MLKSGGKVKIINLDQVSAIAFRGKNRGKGEKG